MPAPDRVDPAMLDAVAARLARARAATREASHELLAHYADTGDAATQRAVDTLIDKAAGTLDALTESLASAALGLDAVAGCSPDAAAGRRSDAVAGRRSDAPRRPTAARAAGETDLPATPTRPRHGRLA